MPVGSEPQLASEEMEDEIPATVSRCSQETREPARSFSVRALFVGLVIGILVNLTNMYYGLQAGTSLQMPTVSGLLGFMYFRLLRKTLHRPLSVAENVLICSAATATGCMPVTAGFSQTIPALEYVLKPSDGGPFPLRLSNTQLIIWPLVLSFFGIVFAALLRERLVVRQPAPWPGATATAKTLAVIHSKSLSRTGTGLRDSEERSPLVEERISGKATEQLTTQESISLLIKVGCISGIMSLLMYFVPQSRALPVFGRTAANRWLWTMTISPGFIGQGVVMGPVIALHMLLGAIVGWGILSPLAKAKGWAPAHVDDWDEGSRAWITWVAVAALVADAMVNLVVIVGREMFEPCMRCLAAARATAKSKLDAYRNRDMSAHDNEHEDITTRLLGDTTSDAPVTVSQRGSNISARTILVLSFLVALIACIIGVSSLFPIPWHYVLLAAILALPLSVVSIRCLAESDFNPEDTLLSHLFFATIARRPKSTAILANLLASGIACAGASQTGDLAYDFKIGQLLNADPNAQIYGHIAGSIFGSIVSFVLYKVYIAVYPIPGPIFQIPAAFIDTNTSRLLLARGVPPGTPGFIIVFGSVFAITSILRVVFANRWWIKYIPSGTSFAVGIYNIPAFTLARVIGGVACWIYIRRLNGTRERMVMVGTALILGESVASVADLVFTALKVPQLT